ncbi:hypothetical protein BU026_13105, partial [Staphylococcus simulans]
TDAAVATPPRHAGRGVGRVRAGCGRPGVAAGSADGSGRLAPSADPGEGAAHDRPASVGWPGPGHGFRHPGGRRTSDPQP